MAELKSSRTSSTGPVPNGDDRPIHGLSVDVEDWFQVWALSSKIRRDDWDGLELRVEQSTSRLLDLFAAHDATATFFVLGWVAERVPSLIKRIVAEGHELASHGYEHVKVFDQTADEFRADVVRTKALLENIGGCAVTGYRAAGFSIDQRTPFAYEVLADTGHLYSSSSHPIAHDHYGDPHAPLGPHQPVPGLTEIPVAVQTVLGRRQSCAGGGWFRAIPYRASQKMWNALEAAGRRGVFYLHPWEVDPEQPSVDGIGLKSRLRHRINLGRMEGKMDRLLGDFRWGRIDRVFDEDIPARPDNEMAEADGGA
ncbi:MAG: XrtA system polysaccharide deacetylase [Parvularcula sp.]